MDLTTEKFYQARPSFASQGDVQTEGINGCYRTTKGHLLTEILPPDPISELNLKETCEFVKVFPMANNARATLSKDGFLEVSTQRRGVNSVTKRNLEAPPTPGRPIFSFSVGNISRSRKNFPSKWDDAEKWLINCGSCHDSPAHHQASKFSDTSTLARQCSKSTDKSQLQPQIYAEKSRVTDEKGSKEISSFQGSVLLDHHTSVGTLNGDVLLKDEITNEVEPSFPHFRCLEPMKEGFLFGNSEEKSKGEAVVNIVHDVQHRDIGTEMTPLGSSTTSRCHTPFKSSSPARHNTPNNRSGPLASSSPSSIDDTIDIAHFQECHLAKLQLGTHYNSFTTNWSSREEEEEEISKSLRHFEMGNDCEKSVSDSKACAWEEEEKTKCCLRYQREEAKIQAWVNLQNAKAEAQSRKLEVKIQKMRSKLEEKLMKRMGIVYRKAEELRAAAQLEHSEQIHKATQHGRKMMNKHDSQCSCGCVRNIINKTRN